MTIRLCPDYYAMMSDIYALRAMLRLPHSDAVDAEYSFQLEQVRLHRQGCPRCKERTAEMTEAARKAEHPEVEL